MNLLTIFITSGIIEVFRHKFQQKIAVTGVEEVVDRVVPELVERACNSPTVSHIDRVLVAIVTGMIM